MIPCTTVPFAENRNGSELEGLITYQVGFNGAAELTGDMGVRIERFS